MTPQAFVHIVDADAGVQQLLQQWLAAAGIESQSHRCLGELQKPHPELPGCVVIDAQTLTMPLPPMIRCPIVVTALQADVALVVRLMKTGASDFVEKPLREPEILAAIRAAIEVDRQRRLVLARHAQVLAHFARLTPRERQVMALVTAGRLNKLVAVDLGVSEITVKAHRGAVMRKMAARSLAELVRMADVIGDELTSLRWQLATPSRQTAPGRAAVYGSAPLY